MAAAASNSPKHCCRSRSRKRRQRTGSSNFLHNGSVSPDTAGRRNGSPGFTFPPALNGETLPENFNSPGRRTVVGGWKTGARVNSSQDFFRHEGAAETLVVGAAAGRDRCGA